MKLNINNKYKVLGAKAYKESGYVDLIKGYNNFVKDPSINNDRTTQCNISSSAYSDSIWIFNNMAILGIKRYIHN